MVKLFKRIWDSFGDKDFFGKVVLPCGGIFFTLGTLAQFYSLSLNKDDLVKVEGKVQWINEKMERITRYTHYPLVIYLTDQEDYYRISDTFKNRFNGLKDHIRPGDSVVLYTRNSIQTILGWGRVNDIFEIDKEGEVIFDMKLMQENNENQIDSFGLGAAICWILYGLYRYNKFSERKGGRQQDV